MAWSRKQQMVLAILPKISSVFSLFGSTWIIIEVATEKRKRQAPYHRLLFAMSVYDVLESLWNFGSTWPIPEGSLDVIWATGNTATCTAQGFFLTLSVAVPIYNAMLSLYYVLVINYRYTNSQLRQRVEPIMHGIAFFWAFGTGLYSALAGLFNDANLWCWMAPLPADCLDSIRHGTAEEGNPNPCIRGDNIYIYRFAFYFIPLWLCIFSATVCTLWVYKYVYARDKETLKYRHPERQETTWWRQGSDEIKGKVKGVLRHGSSVDKEKEKDKAKSLSKQVTKDISDDAKMEDDSTNSDEKISQLKSSTGSDSSVSIGKRIDCTGSVEDIFPAECSDDELDINSEAESETAEDEDKDFRKIHMLVEGDEEEKKEGEEKDKVPEIRKFPASVKHKLKSKLVRWKSRRSRYAEDMPRTHEVFRQACYYVGAFYCTHVWSTSNRIVQTISDGATVFPLIACHSFFDPFQGFMNYLVYQRPKYLQIRRRFPDIGRWEALVRVLRFSYMGDGPGWGPGRSNTMFGSSHKYASKMSGTASSAFIGRSSGPMRQSGGDSAAFNASSRDSYDDTSEHLKTSGDSNEPIVVSEL